ncbi:nuclear receptor coactivator 7 isoform X1 [Trichechus manatus latirostris]|uniref:Nuclear receptor coactivator 7 isoform X1 n=2 Tax=Trichechus manatus latirostris TaxID=127582 RepID=A0A2Y9RN34_TRIMA|nr:nuclear receptor coactivator 7 isoform X1 [Trichechus manatus latirostris]XP_023592923.1 nuclear receptor coactivator 7 isoform X1 [Trichechus manatus latirostris]XP_023592924.1 nuclear receptor coactivator 7 isoform X1 [Trichechus manatus latirostris]XP_023592925.1 nuclear receptor coactivator 7 isoform X1 [Trichechus manatus latirostris]XP_023592926.1 nuclear receptor coactivator 7 isoform X1 [Trichechus manatus latirostris]XP_023592927.1 nuclear receptor coactivator 7 isoform X1 [Trichec
MDTKEEKKERKQSYFARLKKKKQAKQNAETPSATATRSHTGKEDANAVILEQDKYNIAVQEDEYITDEKKKRKNNQLKEIRRTELKRYYNIDDNQNKTHDKKEKKMVVQKPHGTMEYTTGSQDTLNSIALKFNITPNKLVELNKLFTHTIVPGQVLFVPDANFPSSTLRLSSSSPGATVSPSSSDAEYDKLPDADLARKALKPIERVLSSASEEDEPGVVKFLKMNCRYFTDGKGVVGGVMIVTPNNIMFDPHKSDPLVIENGCEEYGLICPMEEVVSIALYNDISHMKIKDALPSDLPQDLCPLYRPGEWEDLASEKDINPFSKFKYLNKEKRQQHGERTINTDSKSTRPLEKLTDDTHTKPSGSPVSGKLKKLESSIEATSRSTTVTGVSKEPPDTAFESIAKENSLLVEDDDFVDLEELSSQTDSGMDKRDNAKECLDPEDLSKAKSQIISSATERQVQSALNFSGTESDAELKGALDLETCEKQDTIPEVDKQSGSPESQVENTLNIHEDLDKVKLIEYYLNKNKEGSQLPENLLKAELGDDKSIEPIGIDITLSSSLPQAGDPSTEENKETDKTWMKESPLLPLQLGPSTGENMIKESLDSSLESSLDNSCQGAQMDNKSEIQLWLLKRIQVPIEDILPSKEEKSKTPPMFLCIKVGKPMRKSFATHSAAMVQQYGRRRKQPEYWFAVPRERVDHLYTFFVQWSPDVYGKDAKEQGFVVVEKEELNMIDNFFSEPTTKSWEIITVEEAKRRKSTCSYYDDEEEEVLPILQPHSALLENMHIEQLARRLPARVQGYPWRLAYSTLEHGTSLKTLYRKCALLDSPVLLVIKDMDNQIFGAYATHPFKFSDHYYGTGETFLYTFSPNFKVFKWSGENSYFINGDISSLELGGGGGRFGLWLDADLYHGRSNSCSTFNNDILSKKEDFIVQDLEVWTFE